MAGLAMVSLVVLTAACGGPEGSEESVAAKIVALETPDKPIRSGTPATASVRIENTGDEDHTFWIGYSVRDPAGDRYDAPASLTRIAAGEEADAGEVLTPPLQTPGSYDSRISVWSDEPGEGSTARRLADVEEVSTLRVSLEREDFDAPELDPDRWKATTRDLGRGVLAPENAAIEDRQLRLALPAGTLNGSEIESADLHGLGFYAARIKVPNAPSSIPAASRPTPGP